jgi:Protein of unknown function (DUF1032).
MNSFWFQILVVSTDVTYLLQSLQEYLAELSMEKCVVEESREVDVAGGQSLRGHCHSEQDPHHNVALSCTNFTNAAILLQNSSNVYSRKVEYLYSLVYQTLQDLNSKYQSGNIVGNNAVGGGNDSNPSRIKRLDPDIEQFECFDPNWNFLIFDENTLPLDMQGDVIDLPSSSHDVWENGADYNIHDNEVPPMQGKSLFSSSPSQEHHEQHHGQLHNTTIANSSTLTQSVGKLSLIQQRKQQQQWMRQYMEQQPMHVGGGGEDVTYRLLNGMCHISDTGALLLPGTTIGQDESDMNTKDSVLNDKNRSVQMDFDNDFDDDHDDGDFGVTGWEMHSPTMANTDGCEESVAQNHTDGDDLIGDPINNEIEKIRKTQNTHEKSTLDPWDVLDPHDVSKSKHRPIKTIKTYRLPVGVDHLPSSAVTGYNSNKVKISKKLNDCADSNKEQKEERSLESLGLAAKEYKAMLGRINHNEKAMDMSISESEITVPMSHQIQQPLSFNTLAYGSEFVYIIESETKRKAAERRKLKQSDIKYSIKTTEVINEHERFQDMYGDNDDDDNYDDEGPAFELIGNTDDHDSSELHVSQERNEDQFQMNPFDEVFNRESSSRGQTFEELCRAHLKEFAKGAEKFAVESQLSKRVSQWQSKIEKILVEEETRPEFDIYTYGTQIMSKARRICIEKRHSMQKQSEFMVSSCHDHSMTHHDTANASSPICFFCFTSSEVN